MSSCRAPALATPSRMTSAASRSAAGSLSVYSQITLPIESDTRPPSASAAATSGCGLDPAGPADMPGRAAQRDAGLMDQPGPQGRIPVGGGSLRGGERGEHPGPGRGADRVVLLHLDQGAGQFGGGQSGVVRGGLRSYPGGRIMASASARLAGAGTPAGGGAGVAVLTGDGHLLPGCAGPGNAGCAGPGSGSRRAAGGCRRGCGKNCAAARVARPGVIAGADLRLETARALGAVLIPLGRRGFQRLVIPLLVLLNDLF